MPDSTEFRRLLNQSLFKAAGIICALLGFIAALFMQQVNKIGDNLALVNQRIAEITVKHDALERTVNNHANELTIIREQREKDRDRLSDDLRDISRSVSAQNAEIAKAINSIGNIQNQVNAIATVIRPIAKNNETVPN